MSKKIISILSSLFILFAILIVFINIRYMFFSERDRLPSYFGFKFLVEMSDSMSDEIKTGDLVIIKNFNTQKLKKGQIISYRDDHGNVITHRIVDSIQKGDKIYYKTKGDGNHSADSSLVEDQSIEGIYVGKIPVLGFIYSFLFSIKGLIFLLFVILSIFCVSSFFSKKEEQ